MGRLFTFLLRSSGLGSLLFLGILLGFDAPVLAQTQQDIVIPVNSGNPEDSVIYYYCGGTNDRFITFDAKEYRSGRSFWVNLEGDLVDNYYSVANNVYSDPTKQTRQADAKFPFNGFSPPRISQKVRVDYNEYRFKLVQPFTPNNFEKNIVFRHYPPLPFNEDINTYVTTTASDTLVACVENGEAQFSLPPSKVSANMDARIHWEIIAGALDQEVLSPVFSPVDGRNVNYSIANIPDFRLFNKINNENLYVLRMYLERPIPIGSSDITGQCAQRSSYKDIYVKVYSAAAKPTLVTGDTVWYCADNPYSVPIQIDKNYYNQFTPRWQVDAINSSPGFNGQTPFISDPTEPGTYIEGITKDFNSVESFYQYIVSVSLESQLCNSPEANLVIMVGSRADTVRAYVDTIFACAETSDTVRVNNVGAPGTIGSLFVKKLAGPSSYAFYIEPSLNPTTILNLLNLALPPAKGVNAYTFEVYSQNGGCPVESHQRDSISVFVLADRSMPLVTNTTNNEIEAYISGPQDIVPIELESGGVFNYRWAWDAASYPSISYSTFPRKPSRYLFKGFTSPAAGARVPYLFNVTKDFNRSCVSDTTKVIVYVNRGYPLYIERAIYSEGEFYNRELLDTISVCTNGQNLELKPRQGTGTIVKINAINPSPDFTNFAFFVETGANRSDTSVAITFNPLFANTRYSIDIEYALYDVNGGLLQSKVQRVNMAPSSPLNPIPNDLKNAYLCAQDTFTMPVSVGNSGVWKQIEGLTTHIEDPLNPNTIVRDLLKPSNNDHFAYAYTWTVDNGFCDPIVDTQRIVVLSALSSPIISSISAIDNQGQILYTKDKSCDTICADDPTIASRVFRFTSTKVTIGSSEWRFNPLLSTNAQTLPTFLTAAADIDSIEVRIDYPTNGTAVYVFERAVYHNEQGGCDTNKAYAYITVERNGPIPKLTGGLNVVRGCASSFIDLESTTNTKWQILGLYDRKNTAQSPVLGWRGDPQTTANLTPQTGEGARFTLAGLDYYANQHPQTLLSNAQPDSFSIDIEMQGKGDYCYFLKDTIRVRILNRPSKAEFTDQEPLVLCVASSANTISDDAIRARLVALSVPPLIGDTVYRKDKDTLIDGIRTQEWQYIVYRGMCDSSRANKTVIIQTADSAIIYGPDTVAICYDANGNVPSVINLRAKSISPNSVGKWKFLNAPYYLPTISKPADTAISLSGYALNDNLNAAGPGGNVSYTLEWSTTTKCAIIHRDTVTVIQYNYPASSQNATIGDQFICAPAGSATAAADLPLGADSKAIWKLIAFTPRYINGSTLQLRSATGAAGGPDRYAQADTLSNGRNLGWNAANIIFAQPRSIGYSSDTSIRFSFGSYANYVVEYEMAQGVQNGNVCPFIPLSSFKITVPPPSSPTLFDYPGYSLDNGGSIIVCSDQFQIKVKGATPNERADLNIIGYDTVTKSYSAIANLAKQLNCSNPSSTTNCTLFDYDLSRISNNIDKRNLSISLNQYSRWATPTNQSSSCQTSRSLQIYNFSSSADLSNYLSQTSSVRDTSISICKGGNVANIRVRVNNPRGSKFVLLKRRYREDVANWTSWIRVDSSIGDATFSGFDAIAFEDGKLEYAVESSLNVVSVGAACPSPGANAPAILPGRVSVETKDPNINSLVGAIFIDNVNKRTAQVCYDDPSTTFLRWLGYANLPLPGTTPIDNTIRKILKWQQGFPNDNGEIEWEDLAYVSVDSLRVNHIKQTTYYRGVVQTRLGCIAYSGGTTKIEVLVGNGASACAKQGERPGLSSLGTKQTRRLQFLSGQKNNKIGFLYGIPFSWSGSSGRTGVPSSGAGINSVIFNAVENNQDRPISDTLVFVRTLDNLGGDALRPQDTIIVYVDIVPINRLNLNPTVSAYTKTVFSENDLIVNELNPWVSYQWITKSAPRTGVASSGNGKGTFSYRSVLTDAPLRDTITFTKTGNTQLNNQLDTVVVYVLLLPKARLALDATLRSVYVTVAPQMRVKLDQFQPGKDFQYKTLPFIRNGALTGAGTSGIPHSGLGRDSLIFTSAANAGFSDLLDTVYFVTANANANYTYKALDTVVYYISVSSQRRLHSNSNQTAIEYLQDSVDVEKYINRQVPFSWRASSSINYRNYPFNGAPAQGTTGAGVNDFRYYAPSSKNARVDTIRFVRSVGASDNSFYDTFNLIVRVFEPTHLNTKTGLTRRDTVEVYSAYGETLSVSSPVITYGVSYEWRNLSGIDKIGIPPTGNRANLPFGGPLTSPSNLSMEKDTFIITRTDFPLLNTYRDTVVLIVNLGGRRSLVNTSNIQNIRNSRGYYIARVQVPYAANGISVVDKVDLINSNVDYGWIKININPTTGVVFRNTATDLIDKGIYINSTINSLPPAASRQNQLEISANENKTGSSIFDTFFLRRVGIPSPILTGEDSLIIIVQSLPLRPLLKPYVSPNRIEFVLDYKDTNLVIGSQYLNPNVDFRFYNVNLPRANPRAPSMISGSNMQTLLSAFRYVNSITLPIQKNNSNDTYIDSFLLASSLNSTTQDSLYIVIYQNPVRRLRQRGVSKYVYRDFYGTALALPFYIDNSSLNRGVAFGKIIRGGASASPHDRDSALIIPSPVAGKQDTIILYRTSFADIALNDEDTLYVILRYAPEQRLRNKGYNKIQDIYLQSAIADGQMLTIEKEINLLLSYAFRLDTARSGQGNVFDSVFIGSTPGYVSYKNAVNANGTGAISLKVAVNRTGVPITNTLTLTKTGGNNDEEDTLILRVHLAPLPCGKVMKEPFGSDYRVTLSSSFTSSDFSDRTKEYSLKNTINDIPILYQLQSPGNAFLTQLIDPFSIKFTPPTILFQARPFASSSNSNGVTNTLSLYPDYSKMPGYSRCPGDTSRIVLSFLKQDCDPNAKSKLVPQIELRSVNPSSTFSIVGLQNIGAPSGYSIYLKYYNTDPYKVFDFTGLPGPQNQFSRSESNTANYTANILLLPTLVNNRPFTIYDTVFVRGNTGFTIYSNGSFIPGCPNPRDTFQYVFALPPSPRLRPQGSSKYLTFSVYENDTIKIEENSHINAGVDYSWVTNSRTAIIGTPGGSNVGRGDFVFNAASSINGVTRDTILFTRYFGPGQNIASNFGDLDSLWVYVSINPLQRLSSSTKGRVDTIIQVIDYRAQTGNLGGSAAPPLNSGISFTYRQLPTGLPNPASVAVTSHQGGSAASVLTYTVAENVSAFTQTAAFRLVGSPPKTPSSYKDTLIFILRQLPRQVYLRRDIVPKRQTIYVDAATDVSIRIQKEINLGIVFDYTSSDPFVTASASRSDSLDLNVAAANITAPRTAVITLVNKNLSTIDPSRDSVEIVIIQTPINRLRSIDYDRDQIAPTSSPVWRLDEEINDRIPFSYERITNEGATPTGSTKVTGQQDTLNVLILPNTTRAIITDTILVYREGMFLNSQDSLRLIVASLPSERLRPIGSSALLRFYANVGDHIIIQSPSINESPGVQYTRQITDHGAVDIVRSNLRQTLSGIFNFYADTNLLNAPLLDTILLTRIDNNPSNLNGFDSLTIIVSLNPLSRLRTPSSSKEFYIEQEVKYLGSSILVSKDINPGVPFIRVAEFPRVRYENSASIFLQPNLTDKPTFDTVIYVRELTLLRNALDTLIVYITNKPVTRLRRAGINKELFIVKNSRDSLTIDGKYINLGVPFSWTYSASAVTQAPVFAPLDSIKVYIRKNALQTAYVDTLRLVRNAPGAATNNEKDTLLVYIRIPKVQGLHINNAASISINLISRQTLFFNEFTANQPYIYSSKRFSGADKDRVIDSNYDNRRLSPPLAAARNAYIAKADTSLSEALRDTIIFYATDFLGNRVQFEDTKSSLDSFIMYVTLLPENLTGGQRYSRQQYFSGIDAVYNKYLNDNVDFVWDNLSANDRTGAPAAGNGKDSISFLTTLNISPNPYIDTLRFVKKIGANLIYKDTLVTEIVVLPISRLWRNQEVSYNFYGDRYVVIDSFNRGVPFSWRTKGGVSATGFPLSGASVNNVYFTTATNASNTTKTDTVIFIKQEDGQKKGFWDTLKVFINVLPTLKLYDLNKYPNQVAYIDACSYDTIRFDGFLPNVSFKWKSIKAGNNAPYESINPATGNAWENYLDIVAALNRSRSENNEAASKSDIIDTIVVVREPLLGQGDYLQKWDSLNIYMRVRKQPPLIANYINNIGTDGNAGTISFNALCPGDILDSNIIALNSPPSSYNVLWQKRIAPQGTFISLSKGKETPSLAFEKNDAITLRLISTDDLCPNSDNDTSLLYTFSSYDLPSPNIGWRVDNEPLQLLQDTLYVCGTGLVTIENRTSVSAQSSGVDYTWSSINIPEVNLNSKLSAFSFNAPTVTGAAGQNNPFVDYLIDLKIRDVANCFDSSISATLRVERTPSLDFEIPDTICLPNVLYPTNRTVAYDPHLYKWTINGSPLRTVSNQPPAIDLANYIDPKVLDADLTLTLSTTTKCGRELSISKNIHVINRLRPRIEFNPATSSMDTICITSGQYEYFSHKVDLPFYLQGKPAKYRWYLNNVQVGDEQGLITDLLKIKNIANFYNDSIRFYINIDGYNCYSDTVSIAKIVRGVERVGKGIGIERFNYCPPARATFTANVLGASIWRWYVDGQQLETISLSENVRETSYRNYINNPQVIPADTSYFRSYIFRTAGQHFVSLAANSGFRLCPADSITDTVMVYRHPQIMPPNIILSPGSGGTLCLPDNVQFETFISPLVTLDNPLKRYFWSLNDEETFIESSPDPFYIRYITRSDVQGNGDLIINNYAIDSLNCVSLVAPAYITEQDRPVADFIYKDVCLGDTFYTASVQFAYNPIGNSTFLTWDMGDGTVYNNADYVKHLYAKEGGYTITLIVGYNNYRCQQDTFTAHITVYGRTKLDVSFPPIGCVNTPIEFKILGDNSLDTIQNYLWIFGDDPVLSSSERNPVRVFSETNTYNVKITANSKYCNVRDSAEGTIVITQPPRTSKTYEDIYAPRNRPIQLYAEANALGYEWNHKLLLDNPLIYNPFATIDADTRFEVRINFNGCYITDYQNVYVTDRHAVTAPTAFTPNGDGVNDYFKPFYIGVAKVNYFKVYSDAGQEIFSTTSRIEAWDGTYKGASLTPAVFKWVASIVDENGDDKLESGSVVLVR